MKKQFFTAFLLAGLSLNTVSAVTVVFNDTVGHWSNNYDVALHDECGVMGYLSPSGNPLGTFHPDAPITRAELVKMVFQCSKESLSGNASLSDLPADAWFTPYIEWAVTQGFVDGYSDNTFRPANYVNRAEAMKIILLAKYSAEQISGGSMTFPDVKNSDWFAKYVAFGVSRGFISGYKDNKFHPANNLTRGEAAKIISLVFALKLTDEPAPTQPTTPTTPSTPTTPPPSNTNAPKIAGCQIFPANNPWNQDVSGLSVHSNSANYIASIGSGGHLHPDFGSPAEYGIPFVVVDGNSTPKVQVNAEYADESDFGLAPIPANPPIEGTYESDGDRHVLVLDKAACMLYETWSSYFEDGEWNVGSAAKFDLNSNALRPDGWTSADAAGLPVLPGLVRYDEVKAGSINHAIRMTISQSQRAYIHPATHFASSKTDSNLPPMGLRLRMRADYDLSGLSGDALVIATAMKKYGMIVADNGSNWYFSGESNSAWDDENLNQLKDIPGSAFEAVETGAIIK